MIDKLNFSQEIRWYLQETNLKPMDASNLEQIDPAKDVPLPVESNPNKDVPPPPENLIQIRM